MTLLHGKKNKEKNNFFKKSCILRTNLRITNANKNVKLMGATNKKRKNKRESYKISNWSTYNESLKKRGKITIWLSEDIKSNWIYKGKNKPGGKITYSDVAIEFCLIMKHIYSLAYRQTEGFIEDIFQKMSIELPIPSYTQIQRGSKAIAIDIRIRKRKKENLTVVIDSTGLKVYGEGEWNQEFYSIGSFF